MGRAGLAGAGVAAKPASGTASALGAVGKIVAASLEAMDRVCVVGVAAGAEAACGAGRRFG